MIKSAVLVKGRKHKRMHKVEWHILHFETRYSDGMNQKIKL